MYPINLECDVELRILRLDDDTKILAKGIYDEVKGSDFVFQLSNPVMPRSQ